MADSFKPRTLRRKNVKGLALNAAPKPETPPDGDAQAPGAAGNSETRTDTLEIGLEFRLDLRSEDLVVLKELGAGNGGTVSKVMHASTKVVMARKIIRVDAKEKVRKQILRELQVGHDCNSPNIVTFYGAFQNEARDIVLCMEYMDCGSLDSVAKDFGPVRVDVLGKITESVLAGLVYLYETHRIMHRDIKPSNILVNSRGNIKLCDFGVATETVNSIADTFVGTSTYMAPERIQGGAYTVRSDVWSVGLSVMELAVGRFPFDSTDTAAGNRASAGPMGILDLLQQIVHEPAPKLPKSDAFPPILHEFVAKCLMKKSDERPTPRELYDRDAFLQAAKRTPVDLEEWAVSMMERHNRKSYLGPAPPKSLKDKEEKEKKEKAREKEKEKKKESSRPAPPPKPSPSQPSRQPHPIPPSGEIPLGINDAPSRYNYAPSNSSSHSSRSTHSPLNQMPLVTRDDDPRASRPTYSSHGSPTATLDVPARPQMGLRSASSSNMRSQAALHNTALPIRAAPAPNGSSTSSQPSNGGPWRRMRDMMGAAHGT